MNWLSSCPIRGRIPRASRPVRRLPVLASAFLVFACGGPATETAAAGDSLEYQAHYVVSLDPSTSVAQVELQLRQPRDLLREARFRVTGERFVDFSGDGDVSRDGDILRWMPPASGGTLRWQTTLRNKRNSSGYDAWLGEDWGLFRAEDVIPRAATRTSTGAVSKTTFEFEAPRGWSVVTQFAGDAGVFEVTHAERRFKQPTGWIAVGRLGVRRDEIAGMQVTIAAPVNNNVRRLDMLALLNWNVPELARVVPGLPERLTIVSAGDPMWRGGLSAPASLYIHAGRPLLSENGTSTLLHELMHIALGLKASQGNDWIVEGLAEYYGLELLRRSGTLSKSRHERALAAQQAWSREAGDLCADASTGPTTARAVGVFVALDKELRDKSGGSHDLDDVITVLLALEDRVDLAALRATARDLIGENPDALHIDMLPGCRKIPAANSHP